MGCVWSIVGCLAALPASGVGLPPVTTANFVVGSGVGVLLLAGTAAQGYARQNPETARERTRLEGELKRYHGFINAYRDGDNDSVNEILAWDPERLTKIVAAAQTPLDIFRPWDEPRVKAATMLHTDAAIRVLDDEFRLGFHLSLAGRLLQMTGAELRPFARTWYVTVSRVLRDRSLLFVADGLLERGRKHLPGDAVVLYESGILQEQIATFAAFITITATDIPSSRAGSGGLQALGDTSRAKTNQHVAERRRALENAARWLGESLRADPSSQLTQLHLGRVQVLRGSYGEGSTMLGQLGASAVDAETSYLATMFLAAMHHRRGHHDEAEQMYRRAIEKIPSAQSAYVGLSEVLQKLGRGDESREVLKDLLDTPAAARTEPWWWYLAEPVNAAHKRADALRASVRK